MSQVSLGVQVAFKQVHARPLAMVTLHEASRKWLGAAQRRAIACILQPLETLGGFLQRCNLPLAPDLAILKKYALFYRSYERNDKVSNALAELSRPGFESLVALYLDALVNPEVQNKPAAPAVATPARRSRPANSTSRSP